MVSRASRCRTDRIGRLLDDDLTDVERAEMIAHLDDCASCRHRLEATAAGGRWWADLRRFAPDATAGEPGSAGGPLDDEPVCGFLEPSDEAGVLGKFGRYTVVEVIGRGGMGVVLKAFDPVLHRFVALKVLAPQLAVSAAARRRFNREARAAASVSHDHVVAIHSVDEERGLPYLVMPYIAGRSLQERIDRDGPLAVSEVVRIGMQVASGLAAAHAQGLIHRDIKPSNILLENGVERVKITDFGLARTVDDASLTQSGTVAGTPQYMAPEQARGETVDARADLFSLGSVLYAMCTGRSPFRAETVMAVLRRVSDDAPRPVREVNPEVPEWLAAIIEQLLAKEPADRFQSAAEIAEVLGRCLAHLQEPTSNPMPTLPSPHRRQRPGWRRWIGTAAAVLLLGGLTALLGVLIRIKTAEGTLVIEVNDPAVEVRVDGDEIVIGGAGVRELRLRAGRHAIAATRDGRTVLDQTVTIEKDGREIVKVSREPGNEPVAAPEPAAAGSAARALETLPPLPFRVFAGHTSMVRSVAFLPDGRRALSGSWDGSMRLWDLEPARELRRFEGHTRGINGLTVTPDGRRAVTASGDTTAAVWDLESGRLLRRFERHSGFVESVAISPDGRRVLTGSADRSARLWNLETGEEIRALLGHTGGVVRAVDLTGSASRSARPRDQEIGEEDRALVGHTASVRSVAFLPDGRRALTGSEDWTVRLWDLDNGREIAIFSGHKAPVMSVAVAPDGRTAVSAGGEGDVLIWDLAHLGSGKQAGRLKGHENVVEHVTISPDGRRALSCGWDGSVRLWDLAGRQEIARFPSTSNVVAVAFSPDGRRALTGGKDKLVRLWDLPAAPTSSAWSSPLTAPGAKRRLTVVDPHRRSRHHQRDHVPAGVRGGGFGGRPPLMRSTHGPPAATRSGSVRRCLFIVTGADRLRTGRKSGSGRKAKCQVFREK